MGVYTVGAVLSRPPPMYRPVSPLSSSRRRPIYRPPHLLYARLPTTISYTRSIVATIVPSGFYDIISRCFWQSIVKERHPPTFDNASSLCDPLHGIKGHYQPVHTKMYVGTTCEGYPHA